MPAVTCPASSWSLLYKQVYVSSTQPTAFSNNLYLAVHPYTQWPIEKIMATPQCWALVALAAILLVTANGEGCYRYYDHASKYNLDYEAKNYPWDEVNDAMSQNPQLSKVLALSSPVPTSGPPGSAYYKPVSVVCPAHRYMLKAFHYDGKQCYVIKPEVQQVRYTKCSDQSNKDCHYCSYSQGSISKCDEEYEWRTVWAYCKPIYPINAHPPLYPPVHPVKPPVYPIPPYSQKVILRQDDVYVKTSYPEPYPRKIGYYGRRKRGVVPQHTGSIEHVTLFLPFQCSCKSYKC